MRTVAVDRDRAWARLRGRLFTARFPAGGRCSLPPGRGSGSHLAPNLDGVLDRLHNGHCRGGRWNFCAPLHDVDPAVQQPPRHADNATTYLPQSLRGAVWVSPQQPVESRSRGVGLPRRHHRWADWTFCPHHYLIRRQAFYLCRWPGPGFCRGAFMLQRYRRLPEEDFQGQPRSEISCRSQEPARPGPNAIGVAGRPEDQDGGTRQGKPDHRVLGRNLAFKPAFSPRDRRRGWGSIVGPRGRRRIPFGANLLRGLWSSDVRSGSCNHPLCHCIVGGGPFHLRGNFACRRRDCYRARMGVGPVRRSRRNSWFMVRIENTAIRARAFPQINAWRDNGNSGNTLRIGFLFSASF